MRANQLSMPCHGCPGDLPVLMRVVYWPGRGLVYVLLALIKFISQVALIGSSPPRFLLLLLLLPLYPSRPLDPIL